MAGDLNDSLWVGNRHSRFLLRIMRPFRSETEGRER